MIPKRIFFFMSVLALAGHAGLARASGDSGCTGSPSFEHREYESCSDRAVLSPGNDTRLNLMLLLADRGAVKPPLMAPSGDNAPYYYYDRPSPAALLYWPAMTTASRPRNDDDAPGDEGYGRCVSNNRGQAGFLQALQDAKGLSEDERKALSAARSGIAQNCGAPEATHALLADTLARMQSAEGKAFAAYLLAAAVFYGDDPGASRAAFEKLARLQQPWVREAASYMRARADMNAAQVNAYTDYGSFERAKVDQAAVQRARSGFEHYLQAYPNGAYAASARGLIRRVNWLEGDGTRSAQGYVEALSRPGGAVMPLLDEIDTYLIATNNSPKPAPLATREPLLLAVDDLWRMRLSPKDEAALSATELAAQKAVFAQTPALYRYLLAAHAYYVQKKPADVLTLLPASEPKPGLSYLDFSTQALRLQAMQATRQPGVREGLLKLWEAATQPNQRPMVELMLAIHDEYAGDLDRVFAEDSRVKDPAIRRMLLENVAGAELLARQTQAGQTRGERDTALFVLLYRNLTRGRYAEFVTWQARVPAGAKTGKETYSLLYPDPALGVFRWAGSSAGYACPALSAVARTLAATPSDPKAKLCLGEFLRLNGFDRFGLADAYGEDAQRWQQAQQQARTLGSSPLLFTGKENDRQSLYTAVMADAAADRESRAYALYRAIRCYAPSGYSDCGGQQVDVARRRQWFRQLKSEYKGTRWANESTVYW